MATLLPSNFLESSFRTKVEYEASLQLPDDERAAAETAAAAKHGTAADLFNAMSLEQQLGMKTTVAAGSAPYK